MDSTVWLATVAAVATAVIAFLTLLNVRLARRTISILERQQHFQSGPFLKIDIDCSPALQPQLPGVGSSTQFIELVELNRWADSDPSASPCFVTVLLENIQKGAAGIAIDLSFSVKLTFPDYGVIGTYIEHDHTFKGFFLEPDEKFALTIANLKALPTASLD